MSDPLNDLLADLLAENALLRDGALHAALRRAGNREALVSAVEALLDGQADPSVRPVLVRIDRANRENAILRRAAAEGLAAARGGTAAGYARDGSRLFPPPGRRARHF